MRYKTLWKALFLSLLALCGSTTAFALGFPPPKPPTPLERTRAQLAAGMAVALTSQATEISVPIPSFLQLYRDYPIPGFDESLKIKIKKIAFKKLLFTGIDRSFMQDGHDVFFATAYVGQVKALVDVKTSLISRTLAVTFTLDQVVMPFDVHALPDRTSYVFMPENRAHLFHVKKVSINLHDLPTWLENAIFDALDLDLAAYLSQATLAFTFDIPQFP